MRFFTDELKELEIQLFMLEVKQDEMVIVVVGDKQKLEKPLSELHLPIYPLQLP
jgi:hypothetical protein